MLPPALLGLAALGWASGAGAQVLVSNLGQADGSAGSLGNDHAQAFTTGSNSAGYSLSSVEMEFSLTSTASNNNITVTIHTDSNGAPGTLAGTLTNPTFTAQSSDVVLTFTAPAAGIDLAANTTYFFVLDVDANAGHTSTSVRNTASDNEDAGAAAGWSIADTSLFRNAAWSAGNWGGFSQSKKIRINGAAKTPPTGNASGAPTITGVAQVGRTLTASTDGISDPDGLTSPSYSYQWIRVDGATEADISGATSSTYVLAAADQGKKLKVKVSFSDDDGNNEQLTSAATAAVAADARACTSGNAWCATLTVGFGDGDNLNAVAANPGGYCADVPDRCDDSGNTFDNPYGSLSDTTFTLDSTNYTVKSIRWRRQPAAEGKTPGLHLTLDRDFPAASLAQLTLKVDTHSFGLGVATRSNSDTDVDHNYRWADPPAVIRGYPLGFHVTVELLQAANAAPVFADATLTRSIAENTAANTNVGAVVPAATDADGDSLTYTMEGTDAASFDFDASARQIKTKAGVTYDFEAKSGYSVTIRASDGTASDTVAVTISLTDVNEPPDAPAAPTVSATSGSTTSLDVSWTAPANAGRPAISNYDLRYRAGTSGAFTDGPQDVAGTSSTITGLTAGTAYQVQVRASNAEGDGPWSTAGSGSTNTATNNAPAFADATLTRSIAENTAANTNVGAVIPAATDADNDTLTYTMEGTDAASFDFNASIRQITAKAGVTYDFEAKASYSVTIKADDGNGGTDTVAVTISLTDVNEPPAAPAAPTVSATSGSSTSLDVNWTAPANAGRPAISNYDLQYRAGTTGAFTAGPQDVAGTSSAITGLAAGTAYQVQVRASNAEGDSPWSTAGSGSTNTATNAAPVFADATLTRSIAENTAANTNVGAVVPAATDADGDSLTYTMEGTDAASFDFDASARQIKTKAGVTYDFEAKSGYSVTIRASDGTASDTVAVTISLTDVNEPPDAPAAPTVSATSGSTTSLDVSWSALANAGKPTITSYDLQYRAGTGGAFTAGPQDVTGTSATITGLSAGTSYQVQVRASNAEGDGPWSAVGSGTTGGVSVSFASASSSAREDAGTHDVVVRLSRAAPGALTLTYAVGGTATEGADYATLGGSVAVAEGASSATIEVTITDDSDPEGDETVALTLQAGDGYTLGRPSAHTLTIRGSDRPPVALPSEVRLRAGERYAFKVEDFRYRDPDGDALGGIVVETLPEKGALTLSGQAVAAEDEVSRTQLEAGALEFEALAGESGRPYAGFEFKVRDGTGEDALTSAAAARMELHVESLAAERMLKAWLSRFGRGV
ncbi:MAG: fibronectin type III domain-containing protein, partial [Gammaproteobacteria bacterium]|nr:fibronectin type III domain-containing protein [Gammaproteobacteria bacterium]